MDFRDITLTQLTQDIRSGARPAEQLMRDTLASIAAHNPRLNAFVALADADDLLARARHIDKQIAAGADPGPLAGIPVGVKDLEDAAGLPTTHGSILHADARPASRDSIGVQRLRAAGALIVGKTNTPAFGCKGGTDNPLFGATLNPWNPDYCPGGSSGGSAAALAAGLVPLATGSDGGGSIRIPASCCGFSGFKPSGGRVPGGDPAAPMARTLGVRGPMARTIQDTVLALDVMAGDASTDIFALPDAIGDWQAACARATPTNTVIWAPTLGFATLDDNIRQVCEAAVSKLREAGIIIIERDDIIREHPIMHWWALWTAGLACDLGQHVDTAIFERLDPALQYMVQTGLKVSGADYARALNACHEHNYQLEQAFAEAPIILTPTCVGRVPKSGANGTVNGHETNNWVEMTFGLNMSRNPAATVHAGCNTEGLPVGLQIIGRQRQDITTLAAASRFEAILGGPGRAPRQDD